MGVRRGSARRWWLWSVLGMLVLALALPGVALAETTTYQVSETTPLAAPQTNPCTGEEIVLTGKYHFASNYRVTIDETGTKFHSQETKKLSLSGTALVSGAKYQGEQQEMSEENGEFSFDADGGLAPYERTDKATLLLIRQGETGSPDDFYVQFIAHVTYNATGVVTVQGATLNVFCR